MENAKDAAGEPKTTNENPNSVTESDSGSNHESLSRASSRTPFTSLSQVDADLALARRLQEQERAYMMLRMNGDVSESDAGSFAYEDDAEDDPDEDDNTGSDDDEDAFDVQDHVDDHNIDNIDPSDFNSDEAYARALQDAEEREMALQLMALTGIHDWHAENSDDQDESNSQDTWEEVDPDELSYEELVALGEVVGTQSRGLSRDTIASLPSINYSVPTNQDGSTDQCVICRLDYEDGETLTILSCKHSYHPECINNWLQINKVCPVCSAEVVSTSESR